MLTSHQLANIPEELKGWNQWVRWNYAVKSDGKETKVPYRVNGTEKADVTNPAHWGSYLDAVQAMFTTRADGIGFVFADHDPYIGVDLDDCYNEGLSPYGDFCITPPEQQWVKDLDSYTEISPSGTGVKVIARAQLPKDQARHSWGGNGIYDRGRFFAITGNPISAAYSRINSVPVQVLNSLLAEWFPPVTTVAVSEADERLTDEEVRSLCLRAANAEKYRDLDRGEWRSWYTSQSEADAGFIALLAFYTGPCPDQLDRLFRASGMMRDKWDEGRGNGETYGERTTRMVLERTEEYFEMQRSTAVLQDPLNIPESELYPVLPVEKVKTPSPQLVKKRWEGLLQGYPSLSDRPLYLQLVHDHIAPLGKRLGPDWCDWMALSFLSPFFPTIRFENQPSLLWVLGISAQGVGKSVTGDELNSITMDLAEKMAMNLATYTSGSNAGLLRRLAGTNKQVLAYLSEWTGFTKGMEVEHSASMREALLNYYDGRGYSHTLAQEVIEVRKPHLVIAGMTTKTAWASNTDFLDTGNGFYSRFTFVAPDILAGSNGYTFRTARERETVVQSLYDHITRLPAAELAFFDGPRGHSDAYTQYAEYLGLGSVAEAIDLDEVSLDVTEGHSLPGGRLAARVKRVGMLLELLEEAPQVRAGQLRIREANVERAVRLVQRGAAYAQRAYGWLARSKDDEQAATVRRKLATGPRGVYALVLETTLSALEVQRALDLLTSANIVESRIVDGQRVYTLKGA